MSDFYLHVGLSKTGSSTLQRSLFQGSSQLFYLGKHFPTTVPKGCVSKEIFDLLNPLLWDVSAKFDLDELRRKYAEKVLVAAGKERSVIASWEALGKSNVGLFKTRLERLASVVGNVKLLMIIRNPLTWLPSEYLQNLQGQITKRNQRMFGSRAYMDFQTWLQRHEADSGSMARWLSFVANIRIAGGLLGKQNVGVFLFEELKDRPDIFYSSVARFLKLDNEACLLAVGESHYNKRLLEANMEYARHVDSSPVSRLKWNIQSREARQVQMKKFAKSNKELQLPAQVHLTNEWRAKVADSTREGHRWLAREFGLDLEKYDYPL